MPARLKIYKKDPNGLARGSGVYYRRGPSYKGKRFSGGYYSKYSLIRDKKRLSKGHTLDKVGLPKNSVILQTSDGRLSR